MSAQRLFDALKNANIIGASGKTYFELHGLKTVVQDSSIVGNEIQEWLQAFMTQQGIPYRLRPNSQEFPDFLMHPDDDTVDLLEVKCFKKSPNFDVANFMAYCRSLITHAHRLDADYLIFEYVESNTGIVIKNIWLKKVWEICGASERSVLKIQWKQGVAFNIRPATWYSKKTKYPVFASRADFVQAIKKVLDTNANSAGLQKGWFATVSANFSQTTGRTL